MRSALNQPHTLVRIRPGSSKDATGASVLSYTTGATRTPIKCFFQSRGGRFISVEEGLGYNLNAMLYTTQKDCAVQDIFIVNLPGTVGNFRVMNVEAKYDRLGAFSHARLSLQIDTAVLV